MEAIAARILDAIASAQHAVIEDNPSQIDQALETIAQAVNQQTDVMRRIPEHMDPALYFKTFRPYIRFFQHVVYEGVVQEPINFRGETGAQSSIMPSLVAFMKIPHQSSILTEHLAGMRHYMPIEHRQLIEEIEAFENIRPFASAKVFNDVLEAMAEFREVHFGWAHEYINKRTTDPRGTGGTPYMHWLEQLIEETLAYRL
jgi:indoleamine 2,3-dioxygenase